MVSIICQIQLVLGFPSSDSSKDWPYFIAVSDLLFFWSFFTMLNDFSYFLIKAFMPREVRVMTTTVLRNDLDLVHVAFVPEKRHEPIQCNLEELLKPPPKRYCFKKDFVSEAYLNSSCCFSHAKKLPFSAILDFFFFLQRGSKSFTRRSEAGTLYTTDDLQTNRKGMESRSKIVSNRRARIY